MNCLAISDQLAGTVKTQRILDKETSTCVRKWSINARIDREKTSRARTA
jgi:hypothetical protein